MSDGREPQDRPVADTADGADGIDEQGGSEDLAAAARRRRRAAVFGEVLPESTGDERADWGERGSNGGNGSEEWLRAQVPPHHG